MSLRPASLCLLVCLAGALAAFETSGCAANPSVASAAVTKTPAPAANAPPAASRVYRFDFLLTSRADPTPSSSRQYSITIEQGQQGELRSGDNIPLGGDARIRMDAGVHLRCRYNLAGDDILAHVDLELTGADTEHGLRKMSVDSDALVAQGQAKPTLVATLEDSATRERFDLTVAASRLR